MDSRLIFLHHRWRLRASGRFLERDRPIRSGRSARTRPIYDCRSHWKESQEKPTLDKSGVRTKTDTGRRDEYSQALERTLVKELGKLTP